MRIDGIDYNIDFTKFRVGSSFFVPCIHPKIAKDDVKKRAKRLGFEVKSKSVIENGFRGLRVWRIS
jgi:hypothetical protein